ncbi:DUF4124 domain-containing protein [Stutzerimonas tarimensis]|uniref:DUF4124 domain-containing protein n=1 Tax=Stutzerimonas tarimensis TaxID=1507735 RepID=A0ABV7TAV5_9GAMM
MVQRWALLLLMIVGLSAQAEIYLHTDANGNRSYSDRPASAGAQALSLPKPNLMSAEPASPPAEPPPRKALELRYQWLEMLAPAPDETIRDNTGTLRVQATSEPALQPGHRFRLILDGLSTGVQTSPDFVLDNLDRGAHLLALAILDEQGRVLIETAPRPVHIKRVSLVQRRIAQPCQPDDFGMRLECPLADKPQQKRNIPSLPFL